MKTTKIYLVIPVYNDWTSLNRLLKTIDRDIKIKKIKISILIVNDCSTEKKKQT